LESCTPGWSTHVFHMRSLRFCVSN